MFKGLRLNTLLLLSVTVHSLPRVKSTQEENIKELNLVLLCCTSNTRHEEKGVKLFTNGVLKFRLGVSRTGACC